MDERELIARSVARLRSGVLAVAGGLVSGTLLAVATAWLLIRGGENVGQHLSLLGIYFPGYSVTWPGVLIGFFWAGLFGAAVGWLVGTVYNGVARRRGSL